MRRRPGSLNWCNSHDGWNDENKTGKFKPLSLVQGWFNGHRLYFPLAPWAVPQMPSCKMRSVAAWGWTLPLNTAVISSLPEVPRPNLGVGQGKFLGAEPRVCFSRGVGWDSRASVFSWSLWSGIYPLKEITVNFPELLLLLSLREIDVFALLTPRIYVLQYWFCQHSPWVFSSCLNISKTENIFVEKCIVTIPKDGWVPMELSIEKCKCFN